MPKDIVERSVLVKAPVSVAWTALVDPALLERWMGVSVRSTWEVGASVTTTGHYPSHGTVLAVQPECLLQYDQWSRITRLPDRAENRAVVTLSLEPVEDATRITVRYVCQPSEAAAEHAGFFWSVALDVLRRVLEGAEPETPRMPS